MPGKSRRRHPSRRKKGKERRGSSAVAAQQQAVAQTYKPAPQPKASAPSVSAPTPITTQTTARYPYIVAELQRIGILAGIMTVVLVVLALVLS
ncbi:hypothetical protein ES703_108509 [subsurface metagenome]